MNRTTTKRRRRLAALVTGTAAAITSAFGASVASADVITFDHGAAVLSGGGKPAVVIAPADPLEINNVTYGPGNAFATAAPSDFDFAPHSGTFAGVAYTTDIEPLAPVTGSFDPATGEMAFDSVSFKTTVTYGETPATCTYEHPLGLSTENKEVVLGDRFDLAGPPPVNGAVAATWGNVPGDPTPGCGATNTFAHRIGGFWFSNGIPEPTVVGNILVCPKKKGSKGKPKKGKCGCGKGRAAKKKGKKCRGKKKGAKPRR
jgi:hypothetical protein